MLREVTRARISLHMRYLFDMLNIRTDRIEFMHTYTRAKTEYVKRGVKGSYDGELDGGMHE